MLGGRSGIHVLRMILRNTVFVRRIARRALFGPNLTLAGHAAFELPLYFAAASFFQRIGAGHQQKHAG